jgi:uroporphyrinogen decarboxylase
MNGRQAAEAALRLERPPRVPVGLVTGGEWYVHFAGETFSAIKSDPERIADVFVHAYRALGQDLLWTGAGLLNYPVHLLGCPIEDGSSDTPKLTGTVIQNLDRPGSLDLSGRRDIRRVSENSTMKSIVSSHHRIADRIGKETAIFATLWGPMTTAARILGTEPLMMACFERPEKVAELIDFSSELVWTLGESMIDHPDVLGLNISDPVASIDLISPSLFRRFARPPLKELVSRTKRKGKYASLHICGNTTPILEDILGIGPDAFSLEAKVDLAVAGEKLGGKVCVMGNVSPTGAFLSGTPEEVIREGKDCLRRWGNAPGYMLTVGCDFPKRVPLENVLALMSLKSAGTR